MFAILLGCGDGTVSDPDEDNSTGGRNIDIGTLIMRLTDGPFPIDFVDEANVTITLILVY